MHPLEGYKIAVNEKNILAVEKMGFKIIRRNALLSGSVGHKYFYLNPKDKNIKFFGMEAPYESDFKEIVLKFAKLEDDSKKEWTLENGEKICHYLDSFLEDIKEESLNNYLDLFGIDISMDR